MNKKPKFGFVMTRHVRCETSNRYWQESYSSIRAYYPTEMILIVDDNSNPEYVKVLPETPMLENVTIIRSEFPGRGEILGYYYFWKLRPFQKAMIIHDSVFIQPSFPEFMNKRWDEIKTARFLWHFPHMFDEPDKEEKFIRYLETTGRHEDIINDVVYFHRGLWNKWLGCFGVMSIIDYDFLRHLVAKYDFFQWMNLVYSRNERYVIERVFAVICCIEDHASAISLFGNIYDVPGCYSFNWSNYVAMEWINDENIKKLHVLKLWSGR